MSRIGKKPIEIPKDVTVTIENRLVSVTGPKGSLTATIHPTVEVALSDAEGKKVLNVSIAPEGTSGMWGLWRQLLDNMIVGVTKGYSKKLEMQGIGFKVAAEGTNALNLSVGYSHQVIYKLPDGVKAKIEKNIITIEGIDKQLVGETAAQIRRIKKPDAYKGKGIRYVGEVIKLKPGKAAKTGAGAK